MSKSELLTQQETMMAAAQGWSLCHVYDLDSNKWRLQIWGMPSSEMIGQRVVAMARAGDGLATKALRLVMSSQQQGTV